MNESPIWIYGKIDLFRFREKLFKWEDVLKANKMPKVLKENIDCNDKMITEIDLEITGKINLAADFSRNYILGKPVKLTSEGGYPG